MRGDEPPAVGDQTGPTERGPRHDEARLWAILVLSVSALGVVLRAVRLDIPMRYDETVTYLSYASRGWEYVATNYQNPNNHVFHSLLVSWLTGWLGDAPVVIRMPAFIAGCALVPVTAWVGRLAHGREAAFLASTFVATSPVLIEFSTNARGYSLMSLCVLSAIGLGLSLLSGRGRVAWLGLVAAGVLGLYTIPTMAIPWIGITVWLAISLGRRGSTLGSRLRALAPLVGANVLVGVLVAALYSGIVLHNGLHALVGNKYVSPLPAHAFLAGTPEAVANVVRQWTRGVPLALSILGAAGVFVGIWLGRRGRQWPRLLGGLAGGTMAGLVVTRNWGEPRIWLWLLPVVAITAVIGVVEASRRLPQQRRRRFVVGAGGVWAAAMVLQMQITHPVRASQETGAFPEGPSVFSRLIGRYRRGDAIIGDFVDVEPLKFYLRRWSETHDLPRHSSLRRMWVVVNRDDPERARQVRDLLLRMGAPPPEESHPMFTVDSVAVYLFGQPAGAPDVRLLEAIDWHTGVAGHIDDDRARTLMEEVAERTGSPLAKAWMARCRRVGCLGFHGRASSAGTASRGIMDEIRQLAVAGEAEAAFLLGTSYAEGWGGPTDAAESVRWYRSAAEAGQVSAARALGTAYASGRGVAPSDSAAFAWWLKAANAGDAVAQLRVADSYQSGRGTPRDPDQARAWYAKASEREAPGARAALRKLRSR